MTLAVSGGLDSITLLYDAVIHRAYRGFAVVCNFGQPNFATQMQLCDFHCKNLRRLYRAEVYAVEQPVPINPAFLQGAPFSRKRPAHPYKSADAALDNAHWGHDDTADNFALVPARNSLIALYTAMIALHSEKEPCVEAAFQLERQQWDDLQHVQGDGTPAFFQKLAGLLEVAFDRPVRLRLPYMDDKTDKYTIYQMAKALEVPVEKTFSCEFEKTCGQCTQCLSIAKLAIVQRPDKELRLKPKAHKLARVPSKTAISAG